MGTIERAVAVVGLAAGGAALQAVSFSAVGAASAQLARSSGAWAKNAAGSFAGCRERGRNTRARLQPLHLPPPREDWLCSSARRSLGNGLRSGKGRERLTVIACGVAAVSTVSGVSHVLARGPLQAASSVAEDVATLQDGKQFQDLLRGGFDKQKLLNFFQRRPLLVARRAAEIGTVLWRVREVWNAHGREAERGDALRSGFIELGPVFIKLGQTLAQREDLVGPEVAEELKKLQIAATPFSDEMAHRTILDELGHKGPVAPGVCPEDCNPTQPPLFAWISPGPVAAASLGQVYRAKTHGGQEIAVKVQRPGVARSVSLDWTFFFVCSEAWKAVAKTINDFPALVDQVAIGVFEELDYHREAANMGEFSDLHRWLGFVTAPRWLPQYSGPPGTARVLTTEWVRGRRLADLPMHLRRRAIRMATEACLVQLLVTGFVHADPHEGNLLYTDDGRVAFLDFGLIDRISPSVMEGFAEGMKAVVAQDWYQVARALQNLHWASKPVKRNLRPGSLRPVYEECPFEDFVKALAQEAGKDKAVGARFGAMAAAIRRLSERYLMLTPKYVVLLVRTFVTLEGIAARVDPDFNIYTMAVPVTLRRLVTPSSALALEALRNNVLTADGELRWTDLEDVLEAWNREDDGHIAGHKKATGLGAKPGAVKRTPFATESGFRPMEGFLGTADGRALRRIAYDIDARKSVNFLMSPHGGRWRRRAADWMAAKWHDGVSSWWNLRRRRQAQSQQPEKRRMEATQVLATWRKREKRVLNMICRSHVSRLVNFGPRLSGALAALLCVCLAVRVFGGAAALFLIKQLNSGARLLLFPRQFVGVVGRLLFFPLVLVIELMLSRVRRWNVQKVAMAGASGLDTTAPSGMNPDTSGEEA